MLFNRREKSIRCVPIRVGARPPDERERSKSVVTVSATVTHGSRIRPVTRTFDCKRRPLRLRSPRKAGAGRAHRNRMWGHPLEGAARVVLDDVSSRQGQGSAASHCSGFSPFSSPQAASS